MQDSDDNISTPTYGSAQRVLWVHSRERCPEVVPKGMIAVSDDPWMMHVVIRRLASLGYGVKLPIVLQGKDQEVMTLFIGHLMSEQLPFFTVNMLNNDEVDPLSRPESNVLDVSLAQSA